jgi:PTS system nitrogen regulatory IIA component
MDIEKLLAPTRVCFDLQAKTKNEVIEELIALLDADGILLNKEEFKQAVLKREEHYSTGIGMGIAIPHGKDASVKVPALVFGISKAGVDYGSMDDKPAHLFFLIAVPNNSDDTHLQVLSFISRKLMHEEVRSRLLSAQSYSDILQAF